MADKKPKTYDVVARVIKQEGDCPSKHKVGDEILFSDNTVKGKICFSALTSMMGCIYAMRYGAQFPWAEDLSKTTWTCPDGENPVTFELVRKPKTI